MHTSFHAWDGFYFKVKRDNQMDRIDINFNDGNGSTLWVTLEEDIAKRLALALTNTILQEGSE